ncbi:thioesterase II family protein [Streptosporangium nondiastaticum]
MGWPDIFVPMTAPREISVDLVVVPCAGGGPSEFRGWRTSLPADWRLTSVCLPGRGPRFGEPFEVDLSATADRISEAVTEVLRPDGRVLLLGHSMGAILAFEAAVRLNPLGLAVCGSPPPERLQSYPPDDVDWDEEIRSLVTDEDIPEQLMTELVRLSTSVISADLAMLDAYRWSGGRTSCDIWAFYGEEDYLQPEPWAGQTDGMTDVTVVPGGHYFVRDVPGRIMGELKARLAAGGA